MTLDNEHRKDQPADSHTHNWCWSVKIIIFFARLEVFLQRLISRIERPKICRGHQIMKLPILCGSFAQCKSMWMLSDLPFGFVRTCGHLACRYWKLWGRLGGLLGNLTVMQHERRLMPWNKCRFPSSIFDPWDLIFNWSDLWFVSTLLGCFTWYRWLFCWIPFLSGTNEPSFHLLGCWCMSDLTTGLKEVDFCFEMSSCS